MQLNVEVSSVGLQLIDRVMPGVLCRIERVPEPQNSAATRHEFVRWLLVDEENGKHAAAVGLRKGASSARVFRPVQMGAQLCNMFPDAVCPSS
jgi:hypothetical protein